MPIAVVALVLAGGPVAAETIAVSCEQGDVIVAAWRGPMTIIYEGDEAGTLTLKGPYGDLSLPATRKMQAADGSQEPTRLIEGFGTTTATMPDLAQLEACVARTIAPGEEGDGDSYDVAQMGCFAATPPGNEPVQIIGHVKLGIFPGEPPEQHGLVIEVKRTYSEKTKSPSGRTDINSFPAKCSLAGG